MNPPLSLPMCIGVIASLLTTILALTPLTVEAGEGQASPLRPPAHAAHTAGHRPAPRTAPVWRAAGRPPPRRPRRGPPPPAAPPPARSTGGPTRRGRSCRAG